MCPTVESIKNKLNLRCGKRLLAGWTNCDFHSADSRVVSHDLRCPLPFQDGQFDFVYHSHVLEHLRPIDAENLLLECCRVLRSGGVLRVVIPDLEQRARIYLQCLADASAEPGEETLARHEWMTMELVDQLVRDESGGEMVGFIQSGKAAEFARSRIGDEYENVLAACRGQAASPLPERRRLSLRSWPTKLLRRWARQVLELSDEDSRSLAILRLGERHRWMYDRLSLSRLLARCGFRRVTERDSFTSFKADWTADGLWLDVEQGAVRKPDSIYFEAIKP
jgi:predicted SAM-dependent methyltransferase